MKIIRRKNEKNEKNDILEKEGIKHFAKDIRTMTVPELRKSFAFKGGRKVNVTKLIKNLIWQAHTWIKQGKLDPLDGNIRSFWYGHVKPVLSRLNLNVAGERYTEDVYDAFVKLVTKYHLFRYADFGFIDEREHARLLGRQNANLVLFVEKDGLFGLLKRLAKKYDTTAIALGGFPSCITSEYFAEQLKQQGISKVRLFGVVDYDPSGYWIAEEFQQQLRDNFGLEIASVHLLIEPKNLPPELVEACKYELDGSLMTRHWLSLTGGIGGGAYGLEADALGGRRILELYEAAIAPYLHGKKRPKLSL